MIWGPVTAGHGKLVEVKNQWTIDDLLDAHEAIQIKAEMDHYLMEAAKK